MKILTAIAILALITVTATADPYPPHSTVTYVVVPIADITTNMLALVAEETLRTLRQSRSGTPRAVLKFFRYKHKDDPMPTPLPNDEPLTAGQLDHNAKREVYPWAHKKTPKVLMDYKQYSRSEIHVELKKPEWNHSPTNAPEI